MERLALCSKVLYDRDILEKQRRIIELEKKVTPPKIRFKSYEDWERFKTEMYRDVHVVLEKMVIDNHFEYEHMSYQGLTFRQENALTECVYEHLYKGTNNREWSEKIANDVVYSLRTMFASLHKTQLWAFIYQLLRPEDISELIYEHVRWYLDDDSHSPCVIEDLPEFVCDTCHAIVDYVNETQMCIDCEIISCYECRT
jgi:hypothetical protein